ncbi:MAG: 16S rRNA (cytosine(1402)-N(4))-methyltransferase RsmH [Aquisalimonadaceae bacterium]
MTTQPRHHRPVLLAEAVEGLNVQNSGFYIDGTFGRGGHAAAVLSKLGPEGRLWLVDQDPEAIAAARESFGNDGRCRIIHGSFASLGEWLAAEGLVAQVNGVLLDLGVSSPQLDEADRGFSFMRDGPLDMRMNTTEGPTAQQWLAETEEKEIARVLKVYGEERFARRVAAAIREARDQDGLPSTTLELANLVAAAIPRQDRHKHPATRSFQAIRIAVNGELKSLERFLAGVADWLAPHGRLAVISFHSLEDRMVKQAIRGSAAASHLPPGIPVMADELKPRLRAVGKAVRGSESDAEDNPRARSAVLRVAEKVA